MYETLTDPALLASTRLSLNDVWRIHTNIQAQYQCHTVCFVLKYLFQFRFLYKGFALCEGFCINAGRKCYGH